MKAMGIFYGSDNGTTQDVAKLLGKKLNVDSADIIDIGKAKAEQLADYETLVLGSSTQGYGDLQYDWDDFVGKLETANLSGKKVGVFGLGDGVSYSDTFCDAIGILADAATRAGATLIGDRVETVGYSFDESAAVRDDFFCGLPLDEDNESDMTEERITAWIAQLGV